VKKKLALAAAVLALVIALGACTPHQCRMYSLDQFRRAGLSQSAIDKFDCIGYRESRWQSGAKHKNRNGSWDIGLFQINSVHQTQFQQVTGKNYWDYATNFKYNVQYTIWLYRQAGFSPWNGPGC
jgi:hypothetical protein